LIKEIKVPVINLDNVVVGEISLNPILFGGPVRTDLIHAMVVYQMARKRRGLATKKTRAEVSGSGKKPRQQKNGYVSFRS